MARMSPLALTRAQDASGNAVSGASVAYYRAGTSTPTQIFADVAARASLGTSLTSDSSGFFAVHYLDDPQDYKAVVTVNSVSRVYDWIQEGATSGSASDAEPFILASISALRSRSWGGNVPTLVQVVNNWRAGDGGGIFYLDSADTSSADNGGTIVVDGLGNRWKRQAQRDVLVTWFGDCSTGAGFTAALAAAITAAGVGGTISVPVGSYTLTASVTLLTNQTLRGLDGRPTITRGFAGTMIDASAQQTGLERLDLRGAGATYTNTATDRAVLYSNGSTAYQWMRDVWIFDSAGPCVEFSVADAGSKSKFFSCLFQRTTATNPAVVMPTTTDTIGGREFHECRGDGGALLRFNASANTRIIGGDTTNLDFGGSDGAALRAVIAGVRIATGGADFVIRGNDSTFTGCVIAGAVRLEGAAARNMLSNNILLAGSTYTDNSTATSNNVNNIDYAFYAPSVSWLADSVNPSLGNGTISTRAVRRGRKLAVDISLAMGSTTTFGNGPWYFELPAPFATWVAAATSTGIARFFDSGTAFLLGTCVVSAGSRRIYLFPTNGAAGVQSTIPITWATGDSVTLSIEYEIS